MSDHDPESLYATYRKVGYITRENLYEIVWAEPIAEVAEQFGVSDATVRNWCRRLRVPQPGHGYWARKGAGRVVRQATLSPARKGQRMYLWPKRLKGPPLPDKVAGLELFKCPIPVIDSLEVEHELITKTRRALASSRVDEYGIIQPRAWKTLDISVSKPCLDRALRIMNALVEALEKAGYEVGIQPEKDNDENRTGYRTYVVIDGETLFFRLKEKTLRKERNYTETDLARFRRGTLIPGPMYDRTALGILSLIIDGNWYCERNRRSCSDGKKQRLEDCLYQFVRSLLRSAVVLKRQRLEAEEQRARDKQENLRREEAERRRLEAARNQLALENAALEWAHATRIRQFLQAVEEATEKDTDMKRESRAALDTWLEWADRYADAVDSLVPVAGIAERLTQVPEAASPGSGIRDSMRQIEYDLDSISRSLSALDSSPY